MRQKIFRKINNRKGFSLTELLVALALLSVLMIGVTVVINSGLKTYNDSLHISEISSVENMINKALARELRYAEVQKFGADGKTVEEIKIDGIPYSIGTNSAGYLVETSNPGTGSQEIVSLVNIGSYANLHVSSFKLTSNGKVHLCLYTLSNKAGTRTKDVSYSVRSALFLREGWKPGQVAPTPVVPTPPQPTTKFHYLTIKYYIDGVYTDTYKRLYKEGSGYSVTSPVIPGYTVDFAVVSGKIGKSDVTKEVHYTLTKYKITYENMRTTDVNNNPKEYSMNTPDIVFTDAARNHYTFQGWYADAEFGKSFRSIPTGSEGDKTVYAKWLGDEFKLTFHFDDGREDDPLELTVRCGERIPYPDSPTRTGYTFQYWHENSSSTRYDSAVMPEKNLDLYAKWEINKHTVTINYYDTEIGNAIKSVKKSGDQDWKQFTANSEYSGDVSSNIAFGSNYTVSKSNPEGYENPQYSALTESGSPITMTNKSFSMPDEDVTVSVIYTKKKYTLKIAGMNAKFDVKATDDGKATRTLKDSVEIGSYQVLDDTFSVEYGAKIEVTNAYFTSGRSNHRWFVLASDHNTGGSTKQSEYKMLEQKTSEPASDYIYMPAVATVFVGAGSTNSGCLAEGTLITLYDGTQKAIEEITQEDIVLVYNHFTGKLETSHIMIDCHENNDLSLKTVLNLVFDNGTVLRTVNHHGLFDSSLNKYINISPKRYEEYIGDEFYTVSGETIKLTDVYFTEEKTRVYAPLSDGCINVFAEGILTVTPGVDSEECLFSLFDMDENMKYDKVKAAKDILKYGLYTYEDFEQYGLSRELFDAVQGKYLKVAVGKGLLTFDDIVLGISGYNDLFVNSIKE